MQKVYNTLKPQMPKAAILLGCTRQYVYKLVEHGKLPASRLSSRMALIRRSDIEKMFEANPYNPLFMLSCKVCVDLPRKSLGARNNPRGFDSA